MLAGNFRQDISLMYQGPILDLNFIITVLLVIVAIVLVLAIGTFFLFTIYRWRGREERSIDSVLLQIRVQRGNEIKIDAMEQVFASIFSIKKGGWKQKLSVQPTVSFEIVAIEEDIRFYMWAPKEFKDLIEKQIHGGYPDAEIIEVPEY